MNLGSVLLRTVIGVPLTRFFVKKDLQSGGVVKPIGRRYWLHMAIAICAIMISIPFLSKAENFYDKFKVPVDVDESTIYQQYKRMEFFLKQELEKGMISEDEFRQRKDEFSFYKSVLMNPTSRSYYNKFGDIMEFDRLKPTAILEPNFLAVAGSALTYVGWIGSVVFGIGYYLPPGGLLSVGLYLLAVFSIEMETRFVDSSSALTYLFFLPRNDWTPFELIGAMKECVVGFTCIIVIVCGIFLRGQEMQKTLFLVRQILKGNAAVIALLKDGNIKELPVLDDEGYGVIEEEVNMGSWINRIVALISLSSFILFRNSGE
jgi:hypothetical protein